MAEKIIWTTEKRKISDLIPHEANPRQMSEAQVADLKKSIQKFNLAEIPAINKDNKILSGHQRMKIMQLIGRGEEVIDVRIPSRLLTDEEAQEYLLRANKNTASWDWDALASFDVDFLTSIGFTPEELSAAFQVGGFDVGGDYEESNIIRKQFAVCPKCGEEFEIKAKRSKKIGS